MLQADDLINFEKDIATIYEAGHITAPVHLRDGNEQILVDIFSNLQISQEHYVYSTWASHLHALLKGVPPERVKQDILEGRSITLHYPDYNFYSSAIVGGVSPIATGTALALKKQNKSNRVFCFLGDMSFPNWHISRIYCVCAISQDLPITFIIEDNGKSRRYHHSRMLGCLCQHEISIPNIQNDVLKYKHQTLFTIHMKCHTPMSGTGVFVEF